MLTATTNTIEGQAPTRGARVQTAVYLRPDQADGLRAMAESQDRPVAYLIRIAVDRLLRSGAGL